MFGWHVKRVEKQEEKKRQQEIKDMEYYTSGEAQRHTEWLSEGIRELREKKQEESKRHLSPFEKVKTPRITNITGAVEEPWMHVNIFDRVKELDDIGILTTTYNKEKPMHKLKKDLPKLSYSVVVHFTSSTQLRELIVAYKVNGDPTLASEGYFWYDSFKNDGIVSTSGGHATYIIEFEDLLDNTQELFVWVSKAQDEGLNRSTLHKSTNSSMIHTVKYTESIQEFAMNTDAYHLSKEQIEEWGFNPDAFTATIVEQSYLWTTRTHDANGRQRVLQLSEEKAVTSVPLDREWYITDYQLQHPSYWLTESQVRLWGFNPDSLDKTPYKEN